MNDYIETTSIDVETDQPHEPVRAIDIRGREYAAELTPERLLRPQRHWWQDDDLMHRVAWTSGITAAALVIFIAGYLVGATR